MGNNGTRFQGKRKEKCLFIFYFLFLVVPPKAAADNLRIQQHLWWFQSSRTNEGLQQICRAYSLCSSCLTVEQHTLLLFAPSTFTYTYIHMHTCTETHTLFRLFVPTSTQYTLFCCCSVVVPPALPIFL